MWWRGRVPVAGIAALTASFLVTAVTAAGWPASGQAVRGPGWPPSPAHAGPLGPLPPAPAARGTAAGGAVPAGLLIHPVRQSAPAAGAQPVEPDVAPLRHLLRADLMVVSPATLPPGTLGAIRRLAGIRAAMAVDAAKVQMNGKFVAVLGVDPSRFRAFADKPTASDTALWRGVARGNVAVSYTLGRLGKLPKGSQVTVSGKQQETLAVGGLGTVAIPGVDAVVSDSVARSLGFPARNAIVISAAPKSVKSQEALKKLTARIRSALPQAAAVEALVVPGTPVATAGVAVTSASAPSGLVSPTQVRAMLRAALSRVGMPYVWGAAGPGAFDCSGLVQWSFAQAGLVMPRVAADQARTGPAVPVSRLQPGDLLFYHTDPTAPGYISHVAIYLGGGRMLQAPEPGLDVEIVPVDLGSEFAGAVDVSPRVAAAVAGSPVS